MNALARPGRPLAFRAALEPVGPLPPNAAALALALLDFEVNYHLAPSLAAAEGSLTFHTGSRRTDRRDEAAFAFLDLAHDPLDLSAFAQGIAEYPDRSTTIVALAPGFGVTNGPELSGPGIRGTERLPVEGLPGDFATQWRANAARFPLGVDLLFVAADGLVGLPRSSRLVGEG